jgi:hypothetical protein
MTSQPTAADRKTLLNADRSAERIRILSPNAPESPAYMMKDVT